MGKAPAAKQADIGEKNPYTDDADRGALTAGENNPYTDSGVLTAGRNNP